MSRSRSLPLLAAVLGTTVALGACGSDGGDEVDTGDGPPSADDPTGGGQGESNGAAGGGQGDVPDDDPDGGAAEGTGDVVGQGPAGEVDEDDAADASDPDANAGTDLGAFPGDGALSGSASRVGVLSVGRGGGPGDEGIVAAFYRPDEALALGETAEGLLPTPGTCTFLSGGGGIDPDTGLVGVPDADDPEVTYLSAGEAIVVSGPDGTFATLPRTEAFGTVFYAPENATLPGPIPSGLIIDIPGDDFPAFAEVRVPDAPPLTGVSPAGLGGVTADTTFGWNAGDDPTVRVIVAVTLVGPDPQVSISCTAADDGEFRLPASLLSRIPDGQPAEAELARIGVRALQRDDAVLLVIGTGAVER